MNYIVNPIWFYLISVVDSINFVAILACAVATGVTLIFVAISSEYDDEDEYDKRILKTFKKRIKTGTLIAIIALLIAIVAPSKSDMEKMLVASCVTEENITEATNYGKDLVDYIFEKIDGKKEEK